MRIISNRNTFYWINRSLICDTFYFYRQITDLLELVKYPLYDRKDLIAD
jgi:hypothetical protein